MAEKAPHVAALTLRRQQRQVERFGERGGLGPDVQHGIPQIGMGQGRRRLRGGQLVGPQVGPGLHRLDAGPEVGLGRRDDGLELRLALLAHEVLQHHHAHTLPEAGQRFDGAAGVGGSGSGSGISGASGGGRASGAAGGRHGWMDT